MRFDFYPSALIVDDDLRIRAQVAAILERAGFRIHLSQNADEAAGTLDYQGDRIALLFTDVNMPGKMNGFDLAHYATGQWPNMSLVVASASADPILSDMPPHASFIRKPFTSGALVAHLKRVLPPGQQPPLLQFVKA